MKLLEGHEGRGHHIFTDNFYSSPALFRELRDHGFEACGTARENRKGMPDEFRAKLKKGEMKTVSLEGGILAIKWMDKRAVTLLTTLHNAGVIRKERRSRHAVGGVEEVVKPQAIEQYNYFMGGVDKADQLLSYYGFSHRTAKWWRRAFFHLIEVAVVNAFILYRQSTQVGTKLTHERFRVELAKQLLLQAGIDTASIPRRPSLPPQARLCERHFLERVPLTSTGRQSQLDCCVCSRRNGRGRKTTTYRCKQCLVALCVVPCFELYHTYIDPARHLD